MTTRVWWGSVCLCAVMTALVNAQPVDPGQQAKIEGLLADLKSKVADLKKSEKPDAQVADVEVHAKAADWILRHQEFYKPDYNQQTVKVLEAGLKRAADVAAGKAPWAESAGCTIRGYQSAIDGSVQPYALTLPEEFGKQAERRWPLHIVLHGRGDTMNEVSFIHSHEGKPAAPGADFIQLEVYGRGNNAYRWAGETDVFEAFADVRRRFRIDDRRVVLRGFSMGGAGSWHLGLHHPQLWCSVGPGAGFVDFYKYQKVGQPLPFFQEAALHIYDPIDYVLNAANVPLCTYGGELDAQLIASTTMVDLAKKLNVPMKLIVGPGVGHQFHPDSEKEFLAFHREQQQQGRETYPGSGKCRFVTWTLKYNKCNYLTIEEMQQVYKPATLESDRDAETGNLKVKTSNVGVLAIARDLSQQVDLDGQKFELESAADGLLPNVVFQGGAGSWEQLGYDASLSFTKNNDKRKRHDLQGPIDDAFSLPFVCVRGTGKPWSAEQHAWANWTLSRFEKEFDKWMRGQIQIVDDTAVTPEMISEKNLILFGDPSSNTVLARIAASIQPLKWTKESFTINGQKYDPATHGLSLIFANPMNPRRYIVINSGHTFHAEDFKKSNAWLFPRLGDVAVQKFEKTDDGYKETTVWADMFNAGWRLPSGLAPKASDKPESK